MGLDALLQSPWKPPVHDEAGERGILQPSIIHNDGQSMKLRPDAEGGASRAVTREDNGLAQNLDSEHTLRSRDTNLGPVDLDILVSSLSWRSHYFLEWVVCVCGERDVSSDRTCMSYFLGLRAEACSACGQAGEGV